MEHRNAETLKRLQETEKTLKVRAFCGGLLLQVPLACFLARALL